MFHAWFLFDNNHLWIFHFFCTYMWFAEFSERSERQIKMGFSRLHFLYSLASLHFHLHSKIKHFLKIIKADIFSKIFHPRYLTGSEYASICLQPVAIYRLRQFQKLGIRKHCLPWQLLVFLRHIQGYSCILRNTYALLRHILTCSSIFAVFSNSSTFKTLDYSESYLTKPWPI